MQRSRFRTFVGVDLGGGKGRTTAVAVLNSHGDGVQVLQYRSEQAWYDERLIAFLLGQPDDTVVAMDAPLSLPACVRCQVPVCPGVQACVDPTVVWFRGRAEAAHRGARGPGHKPHYTPYTQRATEVVLHEEGQILPRETLGQGMGPLTARAAHLVRALAGRYRINDDLIEVYPKATVWRLFDEKTARSYKKHHDEQAVRLGKILHQLPHLTFGPGQWQEFGVQNDHLFDAVLCAYTAWLWARDGWQLPATDREVFDADGWIFAPPAPAR